MLAHNIEPNQQGNVGVHSWSRDGRNWTLGKPSTAYNASFAWANGSVASVAKRERPVLFFGVAGAGCVPSFILNGVMDRQGAGPAVGSFGNTPTRTQIQPVLASG